MPFGIEAPPTLDHTKVSSGHINLVLGNADVEIPTGSSSGRMSMPREAKR